MSTEIPDVKTVFYEALQRKDPDERVAYLEDACRENVALRAEIESLLGSHERVGDFLPSPDLSRDVGPDDAPITEGPGTIIGRYKLLEKIGEGGMAVVYMAEQQEPIRRKVALKIIKLGMDTRQVIARFEAERQALALMDHPSIAKVLDAGATETGSSGDLRAGRPYFVMELVSGVSITEYCDKNSLSTKDRLALFLQVCHAVQHAHQKGIIHRDLKPSNVMVTHHDGKPVPKVIDFGIAKATNQKLTEKTLFTRYAHIVGTPAYMSPEQAELSDLDIDTRTDIYSLGVLLYELLTGTTPFSEEELRKAGYIEMQRVIREQEPAKPSTKLTTLGDALATVARQRSSTPDLLRRAVRGDLDWIVMKSLEKDRVRRYETASGLAEDVRRHLEHEPVLARGPGTGYRLRKFLRRHRSQTIAVLAMAAFAGAAIGVLSLWNRDRLQLVEAEGFRHRNILSQAREQYAKADRETALETIKPILDSRHVGPEAQLLHAGILVDNRHSDEAVAVLGSLLNERPEIAGAAHSLLARILWESESLDAGKLKEIEEHRRQAEALLPKTAEAYFLRAMTAVTVQEQLTVLDHALELDPKHCESRQLRAFTYYASRKYERLNEDAVAMETLRDHDPLGYSLRATALQELGRYKEAVTEYDKAILLTAKDSPQYLDLVAQRSVTLLRMGDYEHVVVAAEACLTVWPDKTVFRHYLFGALTALGDYDKASAVFEKIVASGQEARQQFRGWCATHVFDNLQAGRSWHPANHEPSGPAFLPLAEAEETYRTLSATGRRITTDGFSAQWSPDGRKLAFSLGVQDRSGVALFDPATKETDLLIVPGKYPRWSPDGRYIAFVRDRQFLRVPDFVAADPKNQPPAPNDQEIWFMKSDGTEPRRLARGVWPSWSQDSTCLYYRSRLDSNLYSISIRSENAEPTRIMACPGYNPSVSPDNQRVAYIEGTSLRVKDVASQTLMAEWPLPSPSDGWSASAWSPTGNELCLGGSGGLENTTGLWIYRLGQSKPAQTLCGPITVGSWAANGTKLVFELGAPHFEIWTADLPANAPTGIALGPSRTPEEHFRAMIALCTHRIETDPQDAYAYSSRAHYHDRLHDRAKAAADMRQWSAILGPTSSPGSQIAMPRRFRGAMNGPFGYQLAFSVGGRDNGIQVLCVAFGQKGRCEMRVFEVPMFVMSLFGLGLLAGLDAPPARADFTFGAPVNIQSTFPLLDPATEAIDCFSADGLEVYFESYGDRPGGQGGMDLWVLKRASVEDNWGPPENLGPLVNSASQDGGASITADGLELYFVSDRPGGYGWDVYVTKRATRTSPWGPPTNLGPKVNSPYGNYQSCVSSDGLELYFSGSGQGGYGGNDIYVSTRATTNDPWGDPVHLGPAVNSPGHDMSPKPAPDGLLLFFNSDRPGGYGDSDSWMTRRANRSAPWEPAVNLGPMLNGPFWDGGPIPTADGSALYLLRDPGDFTTLTWKAPILPIVDFNGDKKVDLVDLVMLIDNWGSNQTLCDIGPMPWGDGKVDIEDLKVFMTYYEKENRPKPNDGK